MDEGERCEADLPAEQSASRQAPRVPGADVDPCGSEHPASPSGTRPEQAQRLTFVASIGDRRTFAELRRRGRRVTVGPLTVVTLPSAPVPGPRVAFAVGRGVGNAVIRNRLRRRLRAALGLLSTNGRLTGDAYLVIAAPPAATASVRELEEALSGALDRLEEILGR